MKFRHLFFAIALFLTCCNSDKKNNKSSGNDTNANYSEEYSLSKADIFEDYLKALDTTDINSVEKASKKFKSEFTIEDTVNNDQGVVFFINFMDKIMTYGTSSAIEEDVDYSALVDIEIDGGKAPSSLEETYEKINNNGFRLRQSEGMFSLQINPFYIQKEFYPYVSANMEIMLQQIAKENLEGYAEDAAIIIPYQSLVQRVIWWEDFLKNNSNKSYTRISKTQFDKYYHALVIGMDNTPAIESQQIAPYFQEAYNYLKDFAPNSDSYKRLQEYINLLELGEIEQAKGMVEELMKY